LWIFICQELLQPHLPLHRNGHLVGNRINPVANRLNPHLTKGDSAIVEDFWKSFSQIEDSYWLMQLSATLMSGCFWRYQLLYNWFTLALPKKHIHFHLLVILKKLRKEKKVLIRAG